MHARASDPTEAIVKLPRHVQTLLCTTLVWAAGAVVPVAPRAQTASSPPEASQFDFWLGDWALTWADTASGTNHVTKRWDRVIVEQFDGRPSVPLEGTSVSVYNALTGKWQQTWVDSQGGYLDFTGGFADGRMILARSFVRDGKTVNQRMVYYNIEPDRFDWNWERSDDGGTTWKVVWKIHYARKT
jgi:hypothetical protein